MNESTAPIAPTTSRIQPIVTNSMPLTDTSTAQIRMAPIAINSRLVVIPMVSGSFRWLGGATPERPSSIRVSAGLLRLDRLQHGDLDLRGEPASLPRLEPPGSDLERRGGGSGHRVAERVGERPFRESRGEECRGQHVARTGDGDGLHRRRGRVEALGRPLLAGEPVAPAVERDQHRARAEVRDYIERHQEVL